MFFTYLHRNVLCFLPHLYHYKRTIVPDVTDVEASKSAVADLKRAILTFESKRKSQSNNTATAANGDVNGGQEQQMTQSPLTATSAESMLIDVRNITNLFRCVPSSADFFIAVRLIASTLNNNTRYHIV